MLMGYFNARTTNNQSLQLRNEEEGKTIPYGWKRVKINHGQEFHEMEMGALL
jgi:hypothetical protein